MAIFVPVGMRASIPPADDVLIVNTCSDNDSTFLGDAVRWSWSNPTNRMYSATLGFTGGELRAVSVEAMWQGTKVLPNTPGLVQRDGGFYLDTESFKAANRDALSGNWRTHKGKKPVGAWVGPDKPLIRSPGEARRSIYLPVYLDQLTKMTKLTQPRTLVDLARFKYSKVFLRDHDTGYSINANRALSHAFLLSAFLNGQSWAELP